jgi:replicative DNA helicase
VSDINDAKFAAERALVGAAISATDVALAVTEQVRAEEFRLGAHQIVMETVNGMLGVGDPITENTVLDELQKTNRIAQAGGGPYLTMLVGQAAIPGQIGYYAKQVKDRAWNDRFAAFGTRCEQLAGNGSMSPEEKLERLNAWVDELSATTAQTTTVRAADLVYEVMEEIERGEDTDVLTTGLVDLDEGLSLRPGQLIVVGARPGVGKTVFGVDVARHVGIKQEQQVYFLSLEMSRNELVKRMISAEGKVNLRNILHHRDDRPLLTDDDWQRMAKATERINKSSITIDDPPSAGLAHIRARLRHMQRTGGVRVAVVDYLGILTTSGRVENRQQAVAELTRGLKQLAREIDIPVILLAQLNRQVEGRADRRPVLSDLKDSGAIEADADVVILLHREDAYDRESPRAGEIDLQVDKSRHGPQFVTTAAFQGHYCRIVDMAAPAANSSPATHGHLRPVS